MPVSLKKKEETSTEVIEEKENKTENCTSEHPYSDVLLILTAMLCVVLLFSIVLIAFFKFITSCPELFGDELVEYLTVNGRTLVCVLCAAFFSFFTFKYVLDLFKRQ